MRAVSASFLSALTGAHGMATSCRIASHAGPPVLGGDVRVVSGQVTLDGTADVRGSLDLVLAGRWPTNAEILDDVTTGKTTAGTASRPHPYGVQVQVARGVKFGSGAVELAKLGVFCVQTVEQDGLRATPEVHVTGQDRSALVIERGVEVPAQFPADTMWADFAAALLTQAHSGLVAELDFPGTTPLGRDLILEEGDGKDRWAFLTDAAAARGKAAWFDADGVCQIADLPDPGVPVWTVAAGPGGVLVSSGRKLRRDGQANGVVAIGEAVTETPPARGFAYDSGTSSPTQWGDAFGRRLKRFASPLLLDDAMAAAAAATVLRRSVGLPYQLDLSAVPNPALEPWDVLEVRHSATDVEHHVVDKVTIPLAADGALTLATRETSTVVVDVA